MTYYLQPSSHVRFLASDLAAWDRLVTSSPEVRAHGALDLQNEPRRLQPGAAVEILEDLLTLVRVRVLGGSGPAVTGLLPRTWLADDANHSHERVA